MTAIRNVQQQQTHTQTQSNQSINQYQILPETNQENKTTNCLYEYIVYSYNLSALSLTHSYTMLCTCLPICMYMYV